MTHISVQPVSPSSSDPPTPAHRPPSTIHHSPPPPSSTHHFRDSPSFAHHPSPTILHPVRLADGWQASVIANYWLVCERERAGSRRPSPRC